MFFFNTGYLFFVFLPILLLSLAARGWVQSTYARYSKVPNSTGQTGAQVAQRILAGSGLSHVQINIIDGDLTDNYDPRTKTLNLSRGVATSTSVAAEAVAAHEIGHAQQDAQGYFAMQWRSGLVPVANLGSQAAPLIVVAGLILSWLSGGAFGLVIAELGLALFAMVVLFNLVTTPVELNASHRALGLLAENGAILPEEQAGARQMLRAAAFTYWVALIASILTLLYYASLVFGNRRNN
ncbi:MAG TPA: zinc metallopeptidase [Candidatus Limnocylindria bacterium]|nr:zinc metallopeptidase [Candidatus Limnocylindria bacterium]